MEVPLWASFLTGSTAYGDGLVLETGAREAVIGDKSGRQYRVAADVAKGAVKGAQVAIALRPEKVRIQAGPAPQSTEQARATTQGAGAPADTDAGSRR